ncbi:hypothetical protein [Luteipulveratus flavus]|uniref:Lipoprotein n=1 Tax=Luteipulveratus flavus TaxID=3031728 RepID=A0ABT6C3F5_9MICO|nr:hypothetical protein [Luteipulveratus sp. YIM 133296]MDF8263230.1 hypothetical protein [Luteipulveratus sp. YIM 133296]
MTTSSVRRGAPVVLGSSAVLAAAFLSACGSDRSADYAGVCYDRQTRQRVSDSRCDNSSSGGGGAGVYGWHYYRKGQSAPAVGSGLTSGGVDTPPRDSSYTRGGTSRSGGTITSRSVAEGTTIHGKGGGTVVRGGFGSGGHGGG